MLQCSAQAAVLISCHLQKMECHLTRWCEFPISLDHVHHGGPQTSKKEVSLCVLHSFYHSGASSSNTAFLHHNKAFFAVRVVSHSRSCSIPRHEETGLRKRGRISVSIDRQQHAVSNLAELVEVSSPHGHCASLSLSWLSSVPYFVGHPGALQAFPYPRVDGT